MTKPYIIAPAGIGPAGLFTGIPVIDVGQPPAYLADNIDPTTGELLSVFTGDDPIDAAIVWQLRVERDSGPSVIGVGQRFRDITTINTTAAAEIRAEAERVVRPYVTAKQISDVKIDVEVPTTGDYAALQITYTNVPRGLRVEKRIA